MKLNLELVLCECCTLFAQLLFIKLFLLDLSEALPTSIVLHLGALHAEQSALIPAESDVAANEAAAGAAIVINVLSTIPANGITKRKNI